MPTISDFVLTISDWGPTLGECFATRMEPHNATAAPTYNADTPRSQRVLWGTILTGGSTGGKALYLNADGELSEFPATGDLATFRGHDKLRPAIVELFEEAEYGTYIPD